MPRLSRWALRAAFIYLVLGAAGAVLFLWPSGLMEEIQKRMATRQVTP